MVKICAWIINNNVIRFSREQCGIHRIQSSPETQSVSQSFNIDFGDYMVNPGDSFHLEFIID